MFDRKGREARRIVELEQYNARLLAVLDERAVENAELVLQNEQLLATVGSWERLATRTVVVAEVVEPRPYVQWHDSHLVLLSPRDGMAPIDPPTEPRPAPGEAELTDTEAHVVPCPSCGQPHGDGGVCGTDIKEAA